MKKKLFALLLAGTMVLSLAACGGQNPDSSTPSGSSEPAQQSSENSQTPDVTAPPLRRRHTANLPPSRLW